MTGGIVLLGTEYRSHLKYAVKHAYHHLLVKLGALSQLCFLVEIV